MDIRDVSTLQMTYNTINVATAVHTGQFAGQVVRFELVEIQSAELGRKFAHVDRRPIDPPPVVLLRIYVIRSPNPSQNMEMEIEDYSTVLTAGFVCSLELFATQTGQDQPPAENVSSNVVGDKFVQPHLIYYEGKPRLLFVFGDVAIQNEGNFTPRYRLCDLFNQKDGVVPMCAECWGRPFRVFSTKDFPGLPESTDLTRQLGQAGIPVHVRAQQRRKT